VPPPSPIELIWSPRAQARLREIRAYIAQDNPEAAERVAARLVAIVETLKTYPYLGRSGTEPGIRELVVGGTPYIVLYRVRGKRVTILTIWHGAQVRE